MRVGYCPNPTPAPISLGSNRSALFIRAPLRLLHTGLDVGFFRSPNFYVRNVIRSSKINVNRSSCFINRSFENVKLYNSRKSSKVIVRSEFVGTGYSDASLPLSETLLSSKIRGIFFYAVTSVVAIFLIVVMMIAHPFVLLLDKYRRRAHHLIAKLWALATITPFFKIEYEGLENLPPPDISAVFVANHQSFLDIYTLLTLGISFKFISKTSVFLYPIIGWAMFFMGVIPLKRMDSRSQLDCFKRCMDLVKKGASVIFFPEGTRSKDGKLGDFKKGAFSIATKTGVAIVPITLVGTGNIMPPGKEGIINPGYYVKVIVHKPIQGTDPQTLCDEARNAIASGLYESTTIAQ